MKVFLIVVFLFFVIITLAVLVYLLTFDPNEYKGVLVEKIEEAIGKDVRIGDVSLSFFPGLALMIDEISIKEEGKTWSNAILEAVSIEARIRVLPLIKRRLQIDRLFVKSLNLNPSDGFPISEDFRNIELKAKISREDVVINRLTGSIADGEFFVKGLVKDISYRRDVDLEVIVEGVDVSNFLPNTMPGAPRFEGVLDMNLDLSAKATDIEKTIESLSAKGAIKLDEVALKNMNVLTVSLGKLDSILPGVVYKLKEGLPRNYSELLKENHTGFRPIKAYFEIADGRIFFEKTTIESDAFYLVGRGYLNLKGDLNMEAELFMPRDLSAAFVEAVGELGYLQNRKGMITMPVHISGRLPDVSVRPDMDYVMQKLAVITGQELLKTIFRKERPVEGEDAPAPKQKEEVEPAEAIIKTIFDIITAPDSKKE